jgi:hypothetical protein
LHIFILSNNKILYDFADIESYNPNDQYYLDKNANDNCDYDSDGNGNLDANWAIEWQSTHNGTATYLNEENGILAPVRIVNL